MPETVEKKIYQALTTKAQGVTIPAGWVIVLPGTTFTPAADSKYVSVEVHFNRPIDTDAVSQELPPIRQGFMRTNVMLPKGRAVIDGYDVAGTLCEAFKIGTKLYRDTVQVRIDEHPEIGPLITSGTHHTIPVTTRFFSYPQLPA